MKRKVKIEVEADDGTKIRIEVPSNDPEKIYMYLKALNMIAGGKDLAEDGPEKDGSKDTTLIVDRVREIIISEFGMSTFTLHDLYKIYEMKYGESIPKSTLSTYLSRFVNDGLIERIGRRGSYRYRVASPALFYTQ